MLPERPRTLRPYGGRFVPETLVPALDELEGRMARGPPRSRLPRGADLAAHPIRGSADAARRRAPDGRRRRRLPRAPEARGPLPHRRAQDQQHAGSGAARPPHGKRRIIAETGAGSTASPPRPRPPSSAALRRLHGGARRRAPGLNVFRMQLLGARVIPVQSGSRTLKDAMNEAIRDWVTNVRDTHYIIGSVAGPHPYRCSSATSSPSSATRPVRRSWRSPAASPTRWSPASAAGRTDGYLLRLPRRRSGAPRRGRGGGHGLETGRHGAALARGRPGVLHGSRSYVLQTPDGQIAEAHSISAGLDYPGVGPELAWLKDHGRLELRQGHRRRGARRAAVPGQDGGESSRRWRRPTPSPRRGTWPRAGPGGLLVLNVSGRGDKDVESVRRALAAREAGAAPRGGRRTPRGAHAGGPSPAGRPPVAPAKRPGTRRAARSGSARAGGGRGRP